MDTNSTNLVAIPPVIRTVIYYALAVALITTTALVDNHIISSLYLTIVVGISAVFHGIAGSNVVQNITTKTAVAEVPVVNVVDNPNVPKLPTIQGM